MSSSGPSVSVVIPAREREPYLEEAISSALREHADEVVVVTSRNGDSAGTARALGARVLYEDGTQPNVRRNRGADEARGSLLAFLDADDRFPRGRMAAMASGLGDAVTGLVQPFISPDRAEALSGRIRLDPPRHGVVSGALVVGREAFLSLGGFRERLVTGETADWLARAREDGLEVARIERVVLERRIHGGEHLSRSEQPELHATYLRLARERIVRSRRS